MHVETLGSGPRLVLVHGSVAPGWMTWNAQKPLAASFTLVVPIRSGYPPNPPLASIDFEVQARELRNVLEPGDHLVGHSYGGVVALLAAEGVELGSLTVLEPPAFGLAREEPAVEEFLANFAGEVPDDPRGYLEFFLPLVGSSLRLVDPLPPALEAGARAAIAERTPDQAVVPLDALAAAQFPKLVVSGGHAKAFDAVCDVLEDRLGAYRAILPGAGHSIPRLGPPLNALLEAFVTTRSSAREQTPRGGGTAGSPA
ncbi:MAG TPA: alpha/beta fold hydrolase [Gaiellaceae bacterium]|nr:alpha/beta fold hydrolase [Gaiellaceae bacterium]